MRLTLLDRPPEKRCHFARRYGDRDIVFRGRGRIGRVRWRRQVPHAM